MRYQVGAVPYQVRGPNGVQHAQAKGRMGIGYMAQGYGRPRS